MNKLLKFKDFSLLLEDLLTVQIGNETVGKIKSEDKEKITDLISKLSPIVDDIKQLLKSKPFNFIDSDIKNVIDVLVPGADDFEVFYSYLKNRTVTVKDIHNNDIELAFSKAITGLMPNTIQNICKLQWTGKGTVSVGAGELLFGLLLSGGSRPKDEGDVIIDGNKIEVKAGQAAFTGTRITFGNDDSIRSAFYDGFYKGIPNVYAIDLKNLKSEEYHLVFSQKVKDDSGKISNLKYSDFFQKNTKGFWNFHNDYQKPLGIELVSQYFISRAKSEGSKSMSLSVINPVLDAISKGLVAWQPGISENTYKKIVMKYFDEETGKINDRIKFYRELAVEAYKLYEKNEKHDKIIMLKKDSRGKYTTTMIFDSKTLPEAIMNGTIKITSLSFAPKAERGRLFKYYI